MLCEHCGKEISDDSYSCKYCGGIFGSQITVELPIKLDSEVQPNYEAQSDSKTKKKPQNIIITIVAVLIAAVIVFSVVAINNNRTNEPETETMGVVEENTEKQTTTKKETVEETMENTGSETTEETDKETTTKKKKQTTKVSNEENDLSLYKKYLKNGWWDSVRDPDYWSIDSVETCMVDLNGDKTYELLVKIHVDIVTTDYVVYGIQNGKVVKLKSYVSDGGVYSFNRFEIKYDTRTSKPALVFEESYRSGNFEGGYSTEIYSYDGKRLKVETKIEGEYFNIVDYDQSLRMEEAKREYSEHQITEDGYFRYHFVNGRNVSREEFDKVDIRYVTPPKGKYPFVRGTYRNPMPY